MGKFIAWIKAPKVLISLIAGILALGGIVTGVVIAVLPDPEPLSAPTVTLTDNVASWEYNENAQKWEISINGVLSNIEKDVTSKTLSYGETLKVRAIGDGKEFSDSEWSNTVECVKPPVKTFAVTWKNYDGTTLRTDSVEEGGVPSYSGNAPEKPSTELHNYTHSGWTPEITAVTSDAVYTAVFSESVRLYSVNWVSDGIVIKTDRLPYGATPAYVGQIPTKAANAQYSYTFNCWTPQAVPVVSDTTYTASFSETLNRYTVEFYAEDGVTLLETVTVVYGATANYTQSLPLKQESVSHTYVFDKWVSAPGGTSAAALTQISSNMKVYASFAATVKKLEVPVASSNTAYGTVSHQIIHNVPYGSIVEINGKLLTVNGVSITAEVKPANAEYTYTFDGWSVENGDPVTHTTVITAYFIRTKNTYTVTWKNADGSVLLTDENVEYGTMPVYSGARPKHPTEPDGAYIFSGWNPAVESVDSPAEYVAKFVRNENVKIVTFYDEDGVRELGVTVVENGGDASYPNAAPTKSPTATEVFEFEKWVTAPGGSTEANLTDIAEDKSVYASYTASARKYEVTFLNWDGTLISKVNVGYGEAAAAPVNVPTREGYRFDKWNKEFTDIIADTVVTAEFIKQYTVRFVDYDSTVIKTESVDAGSDATTPEEPTRYGHLFTGWNITFENVYSDLTVTAKYVKLYTVSFYDYDGTLLSTASVTAGSAAVSPPDPSREGYTFVGWSDYDALIFEDVDIYARYAINYYTVTFRMPDGSVIATSSIRYKYPATAPATDELFVSWNNSTPVVHGFGGWDKEFTSITANTEVTAVYDKTVTSPVLYIQNVKANASLMQATVSVYLIGSFDSLCGFNINLKYDPETTLPENYLTFNSNDLSLANSKTSVILNENKNEISISWVNGEGISLNTTKLFTVVFKTEFADNGIYPVTAVGENNVIDGELEKTVPLIISGTVTVE